MTSTLCLVVAYIAVPAGLAAAGVLPPVFGPTGLLMLAGLALSLAARPRLFHHLTAALAVGAVAGTVAALAPIRHLVSLGAVVPEGSAAALVAAGVACGFMAHATALALTGTPLFSQGYRPLRQPLAGLAACSPWRAWARWVHARHPARLKTAYCRLHVAVSWSVAIGWIALLGLAMWYGPRTAVVTTVARLAEASPLAGLALACLGLVLLVAMVAICWWLVAWLMTRAAVATGALPPFDLRGYVLWGRFPSPWIKHEHSGRADEPDWADAGA